MSFEKHSNFNKLANFSEVKFGENKPVLEVELNEMQQIQNEARADIIRDTMPSGFVTLGEIDYEHCANNNNQIKLSTESIAYVNGYRITIPKDTIIEIGESDKVREDLVFLEVWKEAVNDIDTLTEYGGENNVVINNPIKDERYPVATSQRVQLKYRIRHVADVDFETYPEGIGIEETTWNQIPWASYPNPIAPQGGRDTLYDLQPSIHHRYMFGKAMNVVRDISFSAFRNFPHIDLGLYISGNGTDSSKMDLKTLDGYVYAIPMFRLIRKPHVGLASPFEYKKIHNQLDPKKFAHLVGQENVEKVHSVEIAGRTYNNHTLNTKDIFLKSNGSFVGFHLQHSAVSKPLKTDTDYLFIINVKSNTLVGDNYSLDFGETDPSNSSQQSCFTSQFRLPLNALGFSTHILHTKNSFDGVYCVSRTQLSNSAKSGGIVFDYMIIEYSPELVDIDFIPYFEGVKSLGELTNNSITVENNLLEEGTYVHELQNHILPTHPEVTHVTWGEDVVIPPEVEIELKNGEEVIQTITQLPVKLETTGEEKLHVKTMKGRTLVNCCNFAKKGLVIDKWNYFIDKQDLTQELKPSTEYTIIAFVENYSVTGTDGFIVAIQPGTDKSTAFLGNSLQITGNGVFKGKAITKDDINTSSSYTHILYTAHNPETLSGSYDMKIMIIEGDYTNVDVSYFEGMQSVKLPVLTTTGKNLFDEEWESGSFNNTTGVEVTDSNTMRSKNYIKVDPNETYTIDTNAVKIFYDKNYKVISVNTSTSITTTTFNTPENCYYMRIRMSYSDYSNNKFTKQIEQGTQATSYEPYKTNILRTPSDLELRGIGDVQDELNLLTGEVTKRVDTKKLKDITFTFRNDLESETTYLISFGDASHYIGGSKILSNITTTGNIYYVCETEGIRYDGWGLYLRIKKDRITEKTYDAVKQYFESTDATIQYQNKTESIKTVDLTEDDYVGKSKVTYQLAEPLNYIPGGYFDEIKGNKLIKRTGVITFDGSSDEQWGIDGDYKSYGQIQIPQMKKDSKLVTNLLQQAIISFSAEDNPIGVMATVNEIPTLRIRPFDHNNITLGEITSWLNDNPLTVIFELANPIEIPLKEVSPLECDFSYYRQLKIGYENYLKELPNDVKDVLENGKVKRITNTITYTGKSSEEWKLMSSGVEVNTVGFVIELSNARPTQNINDENVIANLGSFNYNLWDTDLEGYSIFKSTSRLAIKVRRDKLTEVSVSGFKKMLNTNPLHVVYELVTPVTEELTEENSRYVPYMPLNSYVGSLYVADGINQTKFLTAFSPSEYEIQTSHHYFSNEFNMFEDIKRKKSPYGHKTYLEEVEGKYVEKFIAGLEKHEIEDLRHKVSLTGFDYSQLLQDSFLKLIKGELS